MQTNPVYSKGMIKNVAQHIPIFSMLKQSTLNVQNYTLNVNKREEKTSGFATFFFGQQTTDTLYGSNIVRVI